NSFVLRMVRSSKPFMPTSTGSRRSSLRPSRGGPSCRCSHGRWARRVCSLFLCGARCCAGPCGARGGRSAMPDGVAFAFHFLRPWWLAALVPAALVPVLILRRVRPEVQWGGVIAPHLLKHLIVSPHGRWRIRPVWLVAAGLALGIIALAGP